MGILPKAVWQQLTYCKVPGISNAQEAFRSMQDALGPESSHWTLTKIHALGATEWPRRASGFCP